MLTQLIPVSNRSTDGSGAPPLHSTPRIRVSSQNPGGPPTTQEGGRTVAGLHKQAESGSGRGPGHRAHNLKTIVRKDLWVRVPRHPVKPHTTPSALGGVRYGPATCLS